MLRDLRDKRQALSHEKCEEILDKGIHGVLALSGDDGYPYTVPLNYFYKDGKIYFHCAIAGHKIDAIKKNNKASFCVVSKHEVSAEEHTSFFQSVIAFGRMRIVEDDAEKREIIQAFSLHYIPGDTQEILDAVIRRNWKALSILELDITKMTGKMARELINK